jgi:Glutamine amidotransferase domain
MMGPGIIGRDLDIMKDLGIASQLRGLDASGVFQVKSNTTKYQTWDCKRLLKGGITFSELLFEMKRQKNATVMNSTMIDVFIGHVRSATRGSLSDENAHPFEFSDIVGAHNGTLKDLKYFDKSSGNKTDSELMFADINERGLEPVLMDLDRDSAYALTIYDKVNQEVVFTRNHLRPLAMSFNKQRSVAYWASERDMLEYILDRSGEEYKTLSFLPHFIVRIKPSEISVAKTNDDVMKNLTHTKKMIKELPTQVQLRMDKVEADKLKKELEEKKKADKQTPTFQGGQWTNSQTSIIAKDGTSVVIPIETKSKGTTTNTRFHGNCICGKTHLNLVTMDKARRGTHDTIRYNKDTEQYTCIDCHGKEAKQA